MRARRKVGLVVAMFGCLAVLAFLIVSRLATDIMRRGDAAAALAWDANDPRTLDAFGNDIFQGTPTGDALASVDAVARRALVASPLRSGAVRILGQVAERRGEGARARTLIATAAERWLYDLPAQIWVINADLRAGDIKTALRHVDETLRARPPIWDALLPDIVPLAVSEEGVAPVTELLATNPAWRTRFLEIVSAKSAPMEPLRLLSSLAESPAPPTDSELKVFLDRMIKAGQYREAYLAWVKFLPKERLAALGNVHNGGFSLPPSGLPFDWSFGNVPGARIAVIGRPDDNANLALRVEFNGSRIPFRDVSQMLLLSPGRYELKASGKAEDLQNERGLWWTIACADGEALGQTGLLKGTTGWQELGADFVVPDKPSCTAQRLDLALAWRIPIEEEVSGAVWFDDIVVSPVKDASGS